MIVKNERADSTSSPQKQKKGAPWWVWAVMLIGVLWLLTNQLSTKLHRPPTPLPQGTFVHRVDRANPMAMVTLQAGETHYIYLAIPRGMKQGPGVTMTLQAVNKQGAPVSPEFTVRKEDDFVLRQHFGNFPMLLALRLAPGGTPGTVWITEG